MFVVVKMIVDDIAACCCSHYIVAIIVMSYKIMTQHCFVKKFKREENGMLENTYINNRMLHLDTT